MKYYVIHIYNHTPSAYAYMHVCVCRSIQMAKIPTNPNSTENECEKERDTDLGHKHALHSHCVLNIIELIKLKCENLIWKMVFIIQYILNKV